MKNLKLKHFIKKKWMVFCAIFFVSLFLINSIGAILPLKERVLLIAAKSFLRKETQGFYSAERYLFLSDFFCKKASPIFSDKSCTSKHLNLSLLKEKVMAPSHWMLSQIEKEFSFYEKLKATKQQIDQSVETLKQTPKIYSYKIFKGKLYFPCEWELRERFLQIAVSISEILKIFPLPDMEFFVCLEDACDIKGSCLPILAFSKLKENQYVVTIPDFEMLRGYKMGCVEKIPREILLKNP